MAFEALFALIGMLMPIALLLFFLILATVKIIYQYERGVVFSLGKYSTTLQPGLRFVIPLIQTYVPVDMRTRVIVVPPQDTITKDNVSVKVNAVLYFSIKDASLSVIKINDFMFATSQLAQTTMRNVVGEVTLDQLLANRDSISKRIKEIVDKATDPWGIDVKSVELKDVELPVDMKRIMAKQAEAERLKSAVIIRSQGDADAAEKVAQAAEMLATTDGALHLRTLQSLNDVASDPSNTVIFYVPFDILQPYEGGYKLEKEKAKK
jgi:regulator of protease activity HflC (stomatin/prohibitin superfamily)